jgi:TonB-dependent SusC/RagA subfamily outer membrane receptor
MKLNHLLSSNWQYNLKKLVRVVKISVLLSVIMTLSSFAHTNVYSQEKISVNVENTEILKILDNIESTTDLRFFYDNDIYDFNKKITLSINEETIAKAIGLIFENNLDFRLKQNVVILEKVKLTEKNIEASVEEDDLKQRVVTGLITDNNDAPLPGATIIEVGTDNGTTSDFDGNFSIVLENDEASLQISFIGFVSQTINVGNTSSVNIQLTPDESSLDEIVVTGYGTTKKGDITSSISVLDLDGVEEKAITDVGQLLAGRSAGVRVVQGSGQPGAAPTIFIRGLSSLSGNTQPLYVIDGVVSYSLGALDPSNIEDITVLKDASAAGIYGAAGASNGVVLVTTKKGRKGEYKVSVNSYTGFSSIIKTIPVLDNAGTVDYFNDLNGSGASIPASELEIDNDWQDLIYRNAAAVKGVNAAISGGGENGSFFVGFRIS